MYIIEMFSICVLNQCSTAGIVFSFLVETCLITHALTTRACERSGKQRSGPKIWWSGALSGRGRKRWSVERAESAAHSPLQSNISLTS